jgi:hypothetical protein
MISQFIFPSPSKLPAVMYILPQTPFIRFFYLTISRCVSGECMDSYRSIFNDDELRVVFLFMHLSALGYFFLGLMFNEPGLIKKFRLQVVIDFFTKEKFIDPTEENKKKSSDLRGLTKVDGDFSSGLTAALIQNGENLEEEGVAEKHQSSLRYQEVV